MKNFFTLTLCFLTLSLTAQVDCPNTYDGDEDGAIGISDLLGLLALFGDADTDSDGVWDSKDDCIDEAACNYQANPTVPCYSLDVGGVCGGVCNEDANGDGICDFECGENLVMQDGYGYSTVQIGEQCWFSENLRTDSYTNGDDIPYEWDTDSWNVDTDDRQSFYNADSLNLDLHGRLYNWYAVNDSRGLCPSGWHVATDEDFIELEIELGMTEIQANLTGWRGTDEGLKLKSSEQFDGNNASGFSTFPSGYGGGTGYDGLSVCGKFWSPVTDIGSNQQMRRRLQGSFGGVSRGNQYKQTGLSARCVKD